MAGVAVARFRAHISGVADHSSKRPSPGAVRLFMLALGTILIVAAPAVGVLPGPGGIIVFAVGLALVLRSSRWAKRRYVRLKRRWPRLGHLADRGLMRRRKHGRTDGRGGND